MILLQCVGYANEVGESFRALVHVNLVRFSYVVSSTYVCADAASKGSDVAQVDADDDALLNHSFSFHPAELCDSCDFMDNTKCVTRYMHRFTSLCACNV